MMAAPSGHLVYMSTKTREGVIAHCECGLNFAGPDKRAADDRWREHRIALGFPIWVHRCAPPMVKAMTPSGWAPTLPEGEVWFCGCGRPWGSDGSTWLSLERQDVLHTNPESEFS